MICINARFLSQRITGSQRYCIEIARRLRKLDPDVEFLAPRDILHAEVAEEIGARVVGRGTGVAWEQLELRRELRRRGRPLLASMQYTAPLGYAPSVVTVHDVTFLRREWVGRRFHHWYRFLIPRLARAARRIVTVSEFSKSEIVGALGVPAEKIDVVPCAVSPEFVELGRCAPPAPHGRYVLGAATFNARKNFEGLVRAFHRIEDRDVGLVLVGAADPRIYGRGSGMAELLKDPRIVQAGYVTDPELAGLYRDAAVFVYPSLYEGFGIPPLEAMSLGCPVVASETTSLPEVCGDAAHYVDPRDVAQIAAGIDRVLRDDAYRSELVRRGRERAGQFDWDESARRFREALQADA